jgi:hypothetical protein
MKWPQLNGIYEAEVSFCLTRESDHWRPWIDGYTDVLALLERRDSPAAIARYRRIYTEARAGLESGEAAAQGLVTARPDPLR